MVGTLTLCLGELMKMTGISQKLAGVFVAGAVLATGTAQAAPLAARLDTAVEQQTQVEKVGYRRHYRGGRHFARGYGHRRYHRHHNGIGAGVALGALGLIAGAAAAHSYGGYGYGDYYGHPRYYHSGYGYYPRRRVVVKHVYHGYPSHYGYGRGGYGHYGY